MSLNRSQIGALIRQVWSEITSYRPGIERLVFGLASLGLLNVGYLWIQNTCRSKKREDLKTDAPASETWD
jgi:hypothetical protein